MKVFGLQTIMMFLGAEPMAPMWGRLGFWLWRMTSPVLTWRPCWQRLGSLQLSGLKSAPSTSLSSAERSSELPCRYGNQADMPVGHEVTCTDTLKSEVSDLNQGLYDV